MSLSRACVLPSAILLLNLVSMFAKLLSQLCICVSLSLTPSLCLSPSLFSLCVLVCVSRTSCFSLTASCPACIMFSCVPQVFLICPAPLSPSSSGCVFCPVKVSCLSWFILLVIQQKSCVSVKMPMSLHVGPDPLLPRTVKDIC